MPRRDDYNPYVRCQTLGHAWADTDVRFPSLWANPLGLVCERCGTYRQDNLDRDGSLGHRRYDYADGYRWERGEKPLREEFRLELLALRLSELKARKRAS